ncbi:MAG: hypothetical protein C4516_01045 [Oxalobacter sp.]|nr:MAG: hypothetical protein C4516_01045 [Oxalobacter sp.]
MVPMTKQHFSDADALRTEIAIAAARMIAEEGVSYGTAKRKAAKQVLGNERVGGEFLPSNAQIEDELRTYNELFLGESQPARLRHLREVALELMEDLSLFQPYVTGAVLNGTAGEHSDIHLQLFVDNPKDVEIYLLNKNIDFDVSETPHFKPNHLPVETVSFMRRNEGVHLTLFQPDDLRGALKARHGENALRADKEAVKQLLS